MRYVNDDGGRMQVGLDDLELEIVNNALNEVCNGIQIEDWEFPIRMGVERETAQRLLSEVNDLLKQRPRSD